MAILFRGRWGGGGGGVWDWNRMLVAGLRFLLALLGHIRLSAVLGQLTSSLRGEIARAVFLRRSLWPFLYLWPRPA